MSRVTRRGRRTASVISMSMPPTLPLLRKVAVRVKKTKSGYGKCLDTPTTRGVGPSGQPPRRYR
jgi:hypothetical protein